MSYNTDLQSNNNDLQAILNTINNLPEAGSGGFAPVLTELNVDPKTTTQTFTPSTGVDGYSKVNVSAIQTQTKTATQNGTVTPDSGKYLTSVEVNVPQPSGQIEITQNGTYDVSQKASAVVNVSTGGGSLPDGATVVQIVKGEEASTQIGSGYSLSITYGDNVIINDSIDLAFEGTSQSLSSISDTTDFSVLQGKYVRSGGTMGTTGTFYYIPEGSTFTVGGSNYSKTLTCDRAQKVSMQKVAL